ncbi:MAG: hypothetical protein KF914_17375 [Rhizobiaceae bacterium]|nr:hypothetical protein [Rhizobiaceae bacterium]
MERLIMLPGSPRPTGVPEIIRCLLNPASILIERDSGLAGRPKPIFREDAQQAISDLAFNGTGRSLLSVSLLFETTPRPEGETADVRLLTAPLHRLAAEAGSGGRRPCAVELIWGKRWSFRGAVGRLAEKLDQFTRDGTATRSWLTVAFEEMPAAAGASVGARYFAADANGLR